MAPTSREIQRNHADPRTRHYRKLIFTNTLISASGVLLILAFFTFYMMNDYRRSFERETERLRTITATAASRTDNLFSTILITLRLLDEWMVNNPDKDPRTDPEFNRLVETFRDFNNHRIDLRIVTNTGGIFYFPSKSSKPLADVSDREYYLMQKGMPEGNLFVAEPVLSRVTGKWGIPVSYHLGENRFGLLAIHAAIEFNVFDDLYGDLLTGTKLSASLIRSDGMLLFRNPYNQYIVGTRIGYNLKDRGTETIDLYLPEKTRRTVYFQKMDKLPVYTAIADSSDAIHENWRQKALVQTLAALGIIAGFVLLGIRQTRLLAENYRIHLKLETAARFDSLTGLKNRPYFYERTVEELERAQRTGGKLTMLALDIDLFKQVNDTYGHPAGDSILRNIARTLDGAVRSIDLCGRLGGEEFGIVLTDSGIESGLEVAERIRSEVEKIRYQDWHAGMSIGVAEWRNSDETLDSLFKRADNALYEAKNAGRNRVVAAAV